MAEEPGMETMETVLFVLSAVLIMLLIGGLMVSQLQPTQSSSRFSQPGYGFYPSRCGECVLFVLFFIPLTWHADRNGVVLGRTFRQSI